MMNPIKHTTITDEQVRDAIQHIPDVDAAADAVRLLLEALDVDEGEHTARTPQRVAEAWAHMLAGYTYDPRRHLEVTFPAPDDPGLVTVHGIRVTSTCAHHMLPIMGTATVAYRPAPGQRVVGLSKLSRVVHGYARRLQVQEQLTEQVATAIGDVLNPTGTLVMVTATHDCMRLRGVEETASVTTTVARTGTLSADDEAIIRAGHFSGT